jgi:hypothetical protein
VKGSPASAIANIPIDNGMIDTPRINTHADRLGLGRATRNRHWLHHAQADMGVDVRRRYVSSL